MKKRLYAIRDNKSGFWTPREDMNDDTAKRNFSYLVNTNEMVGFSPIDYDLYYVGEFDDLKAELIPATPIQFIATGREVYMK